MFHDIPNKVQERMRYLEEMDAEHRRKQLTADIRLRQIPPTTGRFIALLAACAPPGNWIEIGTSGGYSTLYLALACRQVGRKITTYEVLSHKAELARETFQAAAVEDVVTLIEGDAREYLRECTDVCFCFLDAEKEVYRECYEAVVPNMVPGGVLVADNALSHREALQPMVDRALDEDRVDALVVPIDRGELVCRKV